MCSILCFLKAILGLIFWDTGEVHADSHLYQFKQNSAIIEENFVSVGISSTDIDLPWIQYIGLQLSEVVRNWQMPYAVVDYSVNPYKQ